jgi:putative nucleotidyltransferase with HDIG domain
VLRVGRLDALEVVLNDDSVSRHHAEVRFTHLGWRLCDLGSAKGTLLNGKRVGSGQWPLRVRDLIQFGDVIVAVEAIEDGEAATATTTTRDETLHGRAYDSSHLPRPGEQLLAMLRAGHHLVHLESETALLQSILHDAVAVLDAQRGAIVLADDNTGQLLPRALVTGRGQPRAVAAGRAEQGGRPYFSQSLALRSYTRGESILCHSVSDDPELALANSIAPEGAMASVLCVLLRTPRKRLGVLHLDRGPWQTPFTKDELHLADALAANVSAGIESAQLLRKQRDLFLNSITILAQAVGKRDTYTGGHSARVTSYSTLLGQRLGLAPKEMELIRVGTPLHDIGKIGVDDAILRKSGKLTKEEYDAMKLHTVMGAAILESLPEMHPIIPIIRSHHERWDGQGYPDKTAGEETDRLARIVSVANAFDTMTSDTPYRRRMPAQMAFAEIEKCKGQQFDPECVSAFLSIRAKVLQAMGLLPPELH